MKDKNKQIQVLLQSVDQDATVDKSQLVTSVIKARRRQRHQSRLVRGSIAVLLLVSSGLVLKTWPSNRSAVVAQTDRTTSIKESKVIEIQLPQDPLVDVPSMMAVAYSPQPSLHKNQPSTEVLVKRLAEAKHLNRRAEVPLESIQLPDVDVIWAGNYVDR